MTWWMWLILIFLVLTWLESVAVTNPTQADSPERDGGNAASDDLEDFENGDSDDDDEKSWVEEINEDLEREWILYGDDDDAL